MPKEKNIGDMQSKPNKMITLKVNGSKKLMKCLCVVQMENKTIASFSTGVELLKN